MEFPHRDAQIPIGVRALERAWPEGAIVDPMARETVPLSFELPARRGAVELQVRLEILIIDQWELLEEALAEAERAVAAEAAG